MKCLAEYIEERINKTPDGGVCSLSKGEYYIERHINIKSRKNITVDGNGSVIVSHYNNGNSEKPTSDVFHIFGCKGVKLCNFVFETDTPVNITGTVESVNNAEGSYVLSVFPEFNVTGKETFMVQNTCDSEGSFDGFLEYYCPDPDKSKITVLAGEIILANTHKGCYYEYLGGGRYQIHMPKGKTERLSAGRIMCVRHSSYGPISILIKNSDNTAVENVTIHSAGGMGIIVLPRSENLYLNNFNIVLPKNTKRLMSGNCDGIHITGLGGKLTMKNCDFSGLGDDALNIHSTAATVTAIDEENSVMKCNYCKKSPDGLLSPDWCRKGDIITVLKADDCTAAGQIEVLSFEKDKLKFKTLSGVVCVGNILQNKAFSAAVEISDCTVKNTRARGFLLQSENIEIKNCDFFGISSAALLAAPDTTLWYEVGPIKNMSVTGNRFIKCAFTGNDKENSVIVVKNSHRQKEKREYGVHSDIKISDNTFFGKSGRCISIVSTDRLLVENNSFKDYTYADGYDTVETEKCTNSTIENNRIDEVDEND